MNISQALKSSLQTITPIWSSELVTMLAIGPHYSTIINILFNSGIQLVVCDEYVHYLITVLVVVCAIYYLKAKTLLLNNLRFFNYFTSTGSDADMVAVLGSMDVGFIERVLFKEPQYLVNKPYWIFKNGMYVSRDGIFDYNAHDAMLKHDQRYLLQLDDEPKTSIQLWITGVGSTTDNAASRHMHIKFIKGDRDTYMTWLNRKKELFDTVGNAINIVHDGVEYKSKIPANPLHGYYHVNLNYIISLVESVHARKDGRSKQIGLLLYGPPGTGKTSLARRIAEHLRRHVVSVKLSNVYTKVDLYKYLYDASGYGAKDAVILLDELDKTAHKLSKITELNRLQEQYKYNSAHKLSMQAAMEAAMQNVMEMSAIQPPTSIDTSQGGGKDQVNAEKLKSATTSLGQYNWDISDLLSCLSGIIVPAGRIIIATCNNLEDITQYCPELIREGRLTPIECPYGDAVALQAISKDYGVDLCDHLSKLPADFSFRQSALVEFLETQINLSPEKVISYIRGVNNPPSPPRHKLGTNLPQS